MSRFRIREWYAAHAANYFAGFGAGERFWQEQVLCVPHLQSAKVAGKARLHARQSGEGGPRAACRRVGGGVQRGGTFATRGWASRSRGLNDRRGSRVAIQTQKRLLQAQVASNLGHPRSGEMKER